MVVDAVGRYRLQRKLANGNMGEVFLAEYAGDAGFRKRVVVKRLYRHLQHHPEALRMFQDEAHVLSCLSHPNIPQAYDLGSSDGHWYLVIEYVPGHTLSELCAAAARVGVAMPLDAIVSVIEQLCDALHHAHERNDDAGRPMRIVHRDVTPHNLMITADGFAKLLDFGVARTAKDESKGGSLKGTLAYMAPEQVRGQRLDKRSDVFSTGVILYELTTGRRLFNGSEIDVMTSIVERDVTPPSVFIPGFPRELERILLTALARDRARRFPSAQHLARALEELAVSLGVIATHQALARFYQQVISEDERRERTTGTFGTALVAKTIAAAAAAGESTGVGAHPRASASSSGAIPLAALRAEPPSEQFVSDAPGDFRLPGAGDFDPPPVVLTRPKR
ncbi:MAG TPA: serine/threonine-protein kinase [Polyangiales bacterium]